MMSPIFTNLGSFGISFLILLLISSTILIAICWLGIRSASRSSASHRSCIWQSAFAALLLIPVGGLLLPTIPLGFKIPALQSANSKLNRGPSYANEKIGTAIYPSKNDLARTALTGTPHSKSARSDTNANANSPTLVSLNHQANQLQNSPSNGDLATQLPQKNPQFAPTSPGPLSSAAQTPWFIGAWFAGMTYFLFRFGLSNWKAAKISRNALALPLNKIQFAPASIPILISNEIEVPFTTGFFKPTILLPADATDWSDTRLDLVLRHELAHVSRHDVFWQSIVLIAKSIYWFNPMVWLAGQKLAIERELACDDMVVSAGIRASDYASVLVEFASELAGRPIVVLGTLSFTQKSIEKRLTSILEPSTNRAESKRWFRSTAAGLGIFFVAAVSMLRPFSPVLAQPSLEPEVSTGVRVDLDNAFSNTDANKNSELPTTETAFTSSLNTPDSSTTSSSNTIPTEVTGFVVDQNEKPIVGAQVDLTIFQGDGKISDFSNSKQMPIPVMTTNAKGEYTFATKGLDIAARRLSIMGFVKADGYPDYKCHFSAKDPASEIKLFKVKMSPGNKISGKVVSPAGETDPPLNAIVRLIGESQASKLQYRWRSSAIQCDANGEFTAWIPKEGQIELTATSQNFAAIRKPIVTSKERIADVPLQKGTSLYGKVLDRDGTPVVGAIVNASEVRNDNARLGQPGIFWPLSVASKTNRFGFFRLPPLNGKFRLAISSQGTPRTHDRMLTADAMPIVSPKIISVHGLGMIQHDVELRACETSKVSGTIRWEDGSPAKNVYVRAYQMVGGSGVDLSKATTNEVGEYAVFLPKNSDRNTCGLVVIGAVAPSGKSMVGYAKTNLTGIKERVQRVNFETVESDLSGIDWELRERDPVKNSRKIAAHKRTIADSKLQKIGSRYALQRKNANYDRTELLRELVELEAKHRGEFAAILAIDKILDWTEEFHFASKLSKIRSNTMTIIQDHYFDHADCDILIRNLATQIYDAKAIELFKLLQTRSPHPHVQAAAYCWHACHLNKQIRNYNILESAGWKVPYEIPSSWTPAQRKNILDQNERMITKLRKLAPEKLKAEAIELAKTTITKFPLIPETQLVGHIDSFVFDRYVPKDARTYANRAESILFEFERMQVGQVIPDVTAERVIGETFELSELRGKVVLIFFASNWHHTRQKEFYRVFRELKEKHKNRPFEIVTFLTDVDLKHAKQPVEEEYITWEAVRDNEKKVMHQWHIRSLPSDLILIDGKGIIQRRQLDENNPKLGSIIEELISKIEK